MKEIIVTLGFLIGFSQIHAQTFTHADTLRGSITPERAWWDVMHYRLNVSVDTDERSISGSNTITFTAEYPGSILQVDLQHPMHIHKVLYGAKELSYASDGNAHFITLPKPLETNKKDSITLLFSGKPRVAKNAPWDGGWSWSRDRNGKPFIATANQGIGASVWWPNKDHSYDEPDQGVDLEITAPKGLKAVGNGRLIKVNDHGTTKTWHWRVVNPINNYGVNINIGDYVHFGEIYEGENGPLDVDYYVLSYNIEKAKEQFKQVPLMFQAFEHWFGPYPFYEDSFKLVEVPYLGMEHQSSVTYGNRYLNGYLGNDLSRTGWGLKFDFIIIHESGHEWFANNISHQDVADMWIHEGFTAYSENLYLDYHFGNKAASEYVIGTRKIIQNDRPIIGTYGVHHEGSSDMYYKGANILHTLRQLIEDDEKWREILRGLNSEFYHSTVSSKNVEEYMSAKSGIDLTEFWEQYLRTTKIPDVVYDIEGNSLRFKYDHIIPGFDMPVIAVINGKETWIYPTAEWKTLQTKEEISDFSIKKDFYVTFKEMN